MTEATASVDGIVLLNTPVRPLAAKRGSWLSLASLLLVTPLFWLALGLVISLSLSGESSPIPIEILPRFWLWAGVSLVLLTLLGAGLWWRMSRRPTVGVELSGMIKIAAVMLILIGLAFSLQELRQTSIIDAYVQTTAHWDYRVGVDPPHHRLTIEGPIGPHFGDRVVEGLAQVNDPVTVDISESPGGLINEAEKAAHAIQARDGSTVIVRRWCASACLTVLMSGQHRLADVYAMLSFHAAAPIANSRDRLLAWAMDRSGREDDAYLISRGVPADIISATNKIGPSHLNSVTPLEALRRGVLTGLLHGDQPIDAETVQRLQAQAAADDADR